MTLRTSKTLLRCLRLKRGISLREQAQRLALSDSLLSGVELRRQVAWPALRRKLAEYFSLAEVVLFDAETGLARDADSSTDVAAGDNSV